MATYLRIKRGKNEFGRWILTNPKEVRELLRRREMLEVKLTGSSVRKISLKGKKPRRNPFEFIF